MIRDESDQSLRRLGFSESLAGGRLLMQRWHKAVRLTVYTVLWLGFSFPQKSATATGSESEKLTCARLRDWTDALCGDRRDVPLSANSPFELQGQFN